MFPTQFTGVSFTWEHVKSKYLFENISLKGFQDLPVLSVTQDKGVVYRDNLDIDIKYDLSTLKNYKLVQPGDFIISLRSFQGGFETSYLTGITSPAYTIFNFIDNQDKDHAFWQYLFKRIDFINSLKRVTFGIRDGKAISFSQFGDVKVKYPSFDEQKHIATALTKLDNTIQLHERKCEELALIKKALLQKLFPKKDEFKPEVRYKNFSDTWEQRKLVSLFSKFTDGDWIESKDQANTGIRLIQTGNIGITEFINKFGNEKWISEETFKKLNCEEIFPGDIIISRLPDPAGRACILPKLDTRMITAVDCTIARTSRETSAEFIVQYLSTQTYFKYVQSCLAGGTRQRISRKNLANFNVSIPTEINEQKQIGFFFKQLDTLIALHKRKLEKLKQLKKFLLQNMFI
ncbi:restriction endonuclease subunit S (plasmid) [Ligilactobacillus salivarius]|nr:restriction endonuclease subunit S [Ligilactobacillus salivarius]